MGTLLLWIPALVSLVIQLDSLVTDRKVRDLMLPVKELAIRVQQEQLDFERKTFAEVTELHVSYGDKITELQRENAALKAASRLPVDRGINPRSLATCPKCRLDAAELTDTVACNGIRQFGRYRDHFKCLKCDNVFSKDRRE